MGGVDVRAGLEHRVSCAGIRRWDVVAADQMVSATGVSWMGSSALDLQGKSRAKHDICSARPGKSQGVVGHGTTPSHSCPLDGKRGSDLDDGIISASRGGRIWDSNAVLDALIGLILTEGKSGLLVDNQFGISVLRRCC